jgi:Zn-finger nucleic acid-binding protein
MAELEKKDIELEKTPEPKPTTIDISEYEKLKSQFDKVSSEISSFKKKEKERMTEEERKNAELLEKEERYKQIEKENNLIKLKSKMAKVIDDEAVLDEISTLMVEGKTSEAVDKQNEYLLKQRLTLEQKIKEELLKSNPTPAPQGGGGTTKKLTDYTMAELTAMEKSNPSLYKKLLGI